MPGGWERSRGMGLTLFPAVASRIAARDMGRRKEQLKEALDSTSALGRGTPHGVRNNAVVSQRG
jgi:hypothetical protein